MKRILLILFTVALAFSGWYLIYVQFRVVSPPVITNEFTPITPQNSELNVIRPPQTFASKTGIFYSATPLIVDKKTEVLANNFYAVTEDLDIYEIYYNEPNGAMMIILYSEPLKIARKVAEAHLQKILPYTKQELCGIDVKVIVNKNVSVEFADQNLGFSFCPTGVNLP